MNKRRRALLVVISLITVLAMVGVVGATTYDYTNSPLLHKAYQGYDDNIPPDVDPNFFEAELTDCAAMSASDDSRAWYSHFYSYEFHRFEFQIDEPAQAQAGSRCSVWVQ